MTTNVDYSYRYPVDRAPSFPILPKEQFKLANQTSITGVTGQFETVSTDLDFDSQILGPDIYRENGERLKQHTPLERNLCPLYPGQHQSSCVQVKRPMEHYKQSDFHRYRRLKDYQPNKIPRIQDILAYRYCPTCCALHVGGCIGCRRNERYAMHYTTSRMPWYHPQPSVPFGRGYYSYLHEKLDNHRTGNFRLSKYP
ncbi:unnamed protein product [Echinostoma caproni]|uniref:Stabilizer of axonemal microtubules 2 n=1 Tax=Echinostoma caproni TaxID=27848 RepID=A0A183AT69_9TREM|nr:unnamed protein product [Echinostoma caproni]